jgi:hypothetical protein
MSKAQSQEYRGNGNHKWEDVYGGPDSRTTRLRVPGGWLYSVHTNTENDDELLTTTFVPMPAVVKHEV